MADNTQAKPTPAVTTTGTLKTETPANTPVPAKGGDTQTPATPTPTPTPALEPQNPIYAVMTNDNAIQSATPQQLDQMVRNNGNVTAAIGASQAQYNPNTNRVLVNYDLNPQQAQQLISREGNQLTMTGSAVATMAQGNNSVRMKPGETSIQMKPDGGASIQVAYEVTDRTAFLRSANIKLENTNTRTVPGSTETPTQTPAAAQTGNTITSRTTLEANYSGQDRTITLSGSHSNTQTNPANSTTISGNIVLNTNRQPDPTNAGKTATNNNFGLIVFGNNPSQTQNNGQQPQLNNSNQQKNNGGQQQNNGVQQPKVQRPMVTPGM